MVLWAYLGLTPGDMPERVPICGCWRPMGPVADCSPGCGGGDRAGADQAGAGPAVGPEARRLFELEVRATDLYTLAYPRLSAAGGTEWREGPVILGGPAPC